jgi:L-alanine-DL-glutamate epimerase-like enolase superfamily enzyme
LRRRLTVSIERWPVAGAFTIARGAKTFVDVVVVEIDEDGLIGRGEATAIYYHGETAASVAAQAESVAPQITTGLSRDGLARLLPRGAARNAVDAALWDLEARRSGIPAWRVAALGEPAPACRVTG